MPSRKRHSPEDDGPTRPRAAFSWYPPHMHRAQKRLLQEVRNADLVIEVRDARLPLGSGNPELESILGSKPRLLLFNKASLADPAISKAWGRKLRANEIVHLFTDVTGRGTVPRLLGLADELVADRRNTFRRRGIRPPEARVIVTGIPNVGKSTLINRLLRKRRRFELATRRSRGPDARLGNRSAVAAPCA